MNKKRIIYFSILNLLLSIFSICFLIQLVNAQTGSPIPVSNIKTGTKSLVNQISSKWEIKKSFNFDITVNDELQKIKIEDISKAKFEKVGEGGTLTYSDKKYSLNKDQLSALTKDGTIKEVKEPGSTQLSELFGADKGGYTDAILSGFQWASMMYGAGYFIGSIAGLESETTSALSMSLAVGTFTGKSLYTLFSEKGELANWFGDKTLGMTPGQFSFASGVLVAAIIFYMSYKETETEVVSFSCLPWDAPTGGI